MSLLFRHGRVARRFVHGQVFQLLKEESKDQVLYSKNFFKEGFFLRRYQTGSSVATRNESWVQTIKNNSGKLILGGTFVLGGISATIYVQLRQDVEVQVDEPEALEQLTNWSGTHEVETKRLLKPETVEELEQIVKEANVKVEKVRPLGSGISPNGLAFCADGMISLAALDKVLNVDSDKGQVRVQAGARVQEVVDAIKPYGLTLQNYASVREQQIGGFIQVSAHGTGAKIPPVDSQVVALKLVTPSQGSLELTAESHPELFQLSRCSLGTLGIVAEVTLQCVPAHRLREETFVTDLTGVKKNHRKWLEDFQHIRYMWIPHTDPIVVVRSNPIRADEPEVQKYQTSVASPAEEECLEHVVNFYLDCVQRGLGRKDDILSEVEVRQLTFTQLRDHLLALEPLDYGHVVALNKVEEKYWKSKAGFREGWSDEILGFDCGGQQWVSEVCFPARSLEKPKLSLWPWNGSNADLDLQYMEDLLKWIKNKKVPAPAPIEQRWSAGTTSPMSPASNSEGSNLFSWVGIIMYLPSTDQEQRQKITERFFEYKYNSGKVLWDKYKAKEHWAKIEIPTDVSTKDWLKQKVQQDYPITQLCKWRSVLDPNNILSNDLIDELFPRNC